MLKNLFNLVLAIIWGFIAGCTMHPASSPDIAKPHQKSTAIAIATPTQFTFSIVQGQKVHLRLLTSGNINAFNNQVGRLYFHDDNCTLGHQAAVTYKPNSTDNLTHYFAQELQWNKSHLLRLAWNDSRNELRVQLDDQTFNIKISKQPRFLAIHHSTPFTFKKIEPLTN